MGVKRLTKSSFGQNIGSIIFSSWWWECISVAFLERLPFCSPLLSMCSLAILCTGIQPRETGMQPRETYRWAQEEKCTKNAHCSLVYNNKKLQNKSDDQGLKCSILRQWNTIQWLTLGKEKRKLQKDVQDHTIYVRQIFRNYLLLGRKERECYEEGLTVSFF